MSNITKASPSSIYLMHKYWGKKPSLEIKNIVKKYSKKGDLILDPFSGYGGLGIEGVLLDRNVILNDLNPIANFISNCILDTNIDMKVVDTYFKKIKKGYEQFSEKWYSFKDDKIITILRNNNDEPLKIKLMASASKKMYEYELNSAEKKDFIDTEKNIELIYWFPQNKLIKNSRISAKEEMKISDLFSKRALLCQSYLYKLICDLPETNEKKLFKFAFTSNLANCSKLVPPIKSRGDMSQGAWMTGFYIGDTYLENNVFHYFENRMNKIIKGKKDYIKIFKSKKNTGSYYIKNEDAKHLSIESNSVDFIFTDFPYGDTVPYFEQSQIWNAWLGFDVDYENEIVISNSSERNKDSDNFSKDIEQAINEISRVLKDKSYFIYTYHSLSGNEWEAISNALLKNNFEFVDCQMLLQKTFTPRQINRKITIKGDLLVIYKKNKSNKQLSVKIENAKQKIKQEIEQEIKENCKLNERYDTNQLITLCVKCLLKYNHLSNKIDFIEIINECFKIDEKNEELWRLKMNYDDLNNLYKNNEFRKIDKESNSKKFYLLRSISKAKTLTKFCKTYNIEKNLNNILSNKDITENMIIDFIKNEPILKSSEQIKDIEAELNKMQSFDWGGSMGNNLEKNIVNNYVKKILKYEDIEDAIAGIIQKSVYGYTLNSWYNHWSTVLIENIFNSNKRILPTVDLVEKIDFFIDSIPYDLKVTYFPEELMKSSIAEQLKEKYGSKSELTCAKNIAKKLNITIPNDLNDKALIICLNNLLKESVEEEAKVFIKDLNNMKKEVIEYYKKNPEKLMIWLYENQGEMRFDAANRFYLVLVDSENIYESWKLKRNVNLLKKEIDIKLNAFDKNNLNEIKFHWTKDGKDYNCISELLFIIK